MNIDKYIEDIERRLDENEEEAVLQSWISFANGTYKSSTPFTPPHRTPRPSTLDWPAVKINDAIGDEDMMLLSQFARISQALSEGSSRIHMIRSNYGVGIIPTTFGAQLFMMPYEYDCLPNVRTLVDGADAIRNFIDADVPGYKDGLGANVFSIGEKYMHIKAQYPKIDRYLRVDHPDTQGPFDLCELLCGSGIFYDLYDNPELIHSLLRKVTDFYISFLDAWFSLVPDTDDYHTFSGTLHKGAICVRDDSAMNLSPAFYETFIYPYDQQVLEHFGGGAVHFCGRGDHYIEKLSTLNHLYAVDLSQPEYNNMEHIFKNTIDKGINLTTVINPYTGKEKHAYNKLFIS